MADKEDVGDGAEWTEGEGVLELVGESGAGEGFVGGTGVGCGVQMVAVAPGFEGAAMLDVAEVIVPGELGDLGVPGKADRGEGKGAKGEGHAGAGASDDSWETRRVGGARWGWGEGDIFDAGLLPGGHEAREVFGIGEEGEDEVGGEGKPLLGVEGVGHTVWAVRCEAVLVGASSLGYAQGSWRKTNAEFVPTRFDQSQNDEHFRGWEMGFTSLSLPS